MQGAGNINPLNSNLVKTSPSQFYLPPEAAYNCIAELGEMGEEEAEFAFRM